MIYSPLNKFKKIKLTAAITERYKQLVIFFSTELVQHVVSRSRQLLLTAAPAPSILHHNVS